MEPSSNTKIYGMDEYFNEIIDLYDTKKMPNKILFSGKEGLGKSTLAYHIINYIFSKNENFSYDKGQHTINPKNISFKLVQNGSHPNFFLIKLRDEKKNIDLLQIREMIEYSNKSSFNNKPRLVLIDNVEKLNLNSVNALLKIVEEPNENFYFILINNSEKKVLSTLKSRCLTFKINFTFDKTISVSNKLLDQNLFDIINHDLISYYNTPGEIVNLINFSNEKKIDLKNNNLKSLLKLLISNNYYKKNNFVGSLIINLIELYILKEYKVSKTKNSILKVYHDFINKVHNMKKYNLDEESLFLEFNAKLLNE